MSFYPAKVLGCLGDGGAIITNNSELAKYAISVLVEHGGSGGKTAAPIAKKIIKRVLERHELRQRVNKLLGEEV